jgi:hypothetical protein
MRAGGRERRWQVKTSDRRSRQVAGGGNTPLVGRNMQWGSTEAAAAQNKRWEVERGGWGRGNAYGRQKRAEGVERGNCSSN